jgi:hypothetical protein
MFFTSNTITAQKKEIMVRISEIEIYSEYLSEYKAILKAEIIVKRLLPCNERAPFKVFNSASIEKQMFNIKIGVNISSLQTQNVTHNFKLTGSSV